jgi:transposase
MKGFVLTKEKLSDLKEAHQKAKRSIAHAAYKINAVILLGTCWTLEQARQALLLDGDTLSSYVKKYNEHGIEALISIHYKGRSSELTEAQEDQIREELERVIHLSTQSVIIYVAHTFSLSYTASGMRGLLHRLGYENKSPNAFQAIQTGMPWKLLSNNMRTSWR